jgi:hypothetical protein
MAIARIERARAEQNIAVKRVLRDVKDQIDDMRQRLGRARGLGDDPLFTPAQIKQFLATYIVFKVTTRGASSDVITQMQQNFESVIDTFGDEAVPALVAALNTVAFVQLGDC